MTSRICDFRFAIVDCDRIADCRLPIAGGIAYCRSPIANLWRRVWLTGALLAIFAGCTSKSHDTASPGGEAVTRRAEAGPVSLTLSAQPAELPFSQRARLTVEAIADKDVTVELEDYQAAVEKDGEHQFEFRVRRLSQANAVPVAEGKLRWTQSYEAEFFLPGEYELPAAKLKFTKVGAAPGAKKDWISSPHPGPLPAGEVAATAPLEAGELTTETIRISAQPTEAAQLDPEEIKKIEVLPPVELKDPWSRWWLAAIPGALALAALAVMMARRRRLDAAAKAEFVPAHEWARRQIAALVADDLIGKGLVQEFYYRISGIVRGYIERRFGVSAPEMTTEEFLGATAGDFRFAGATELKSFMTACDLVKYARHRPAEGEWNDLLRTAAAFVERTKEEVHSEIVHSA